jgi:hypothetical protein
MANFIFGKKKTTPKSVEKAPAPAAAAASPRNKKTGQYE